MLRSASFGARNLWRTRNWNWLSCWTLWRRRNTCVDLRGFRRFLLTLVYFSIKQKAQHIVNQQAILHLEWRGGGKIVCWTPRPKAFPSAVSVTRSVCLIWAVSISGWPLPVKHPITTSAFLLQPRPSSISDVLSPIILIDSWSDRPI